MTIKYECKDCRTLLCTGREVGEVHGALAGATALLAQHLLDTGHRNFGYSSDKSKLAISIDNIDGEEVLAINGSNVGFPNTG